MSEYSYPAVLKLYKNCFFIELPDIPNCVVFEYSIELALSKLEIVVKEYLSALLLQGKTPFTPTNIAKIPYEETEIARLVVKCVIDDGVVASIKVTYCSDYNISSYFSLVTNIAKPIKSRLHEHISNRYQDESLLKADKDFALSQKVYNRLLLRYSILRDIERLERRYSAHSDAFEDVENSTTTSPHADAFEKSKTAVNDTNTAVQKVNPALRAYRLATTDVFVEKAIAFLEDDSDDYKKKGTKSYIWASKIAIVGVIASVLGILESFLREKQFWGLSTHYPDTTLDFLYMVLPKFTFYGMLVALAVGLCRYGKAMLDQSERLREKRHALRQGRLFVHLKDGELNVNELDKAFAWNAAIGNAFGNIETETKSPIGSVLNDIKSLTENIASSITGSRNGSGGNSSRENAGKETPK